MFKDYPFNMEPGEIFKIEIPFEHFDKFELNNNIEIQCQVSDTYRKMYKSKWLKIHNYA